MFKRFFYMVYNTWLRIPMWIWIFALLLPLYGITNNFICPTGNFWEAAVVRQFTATLWIPMGMLIVLSKLGISRVDDATRYLRMNKRSTIVSVKTVSAFFIVLTYVLLSFLVMLLYAKLRMKLSLTNQWTEITVLSLQNLDRGNTLPVKLLVDNFTPLTAFLASMTFTVAYCYFLALLSTAINTLCKAPFGSAICGIALLSNFLFGGYEIGTYSFSLDFNSSLHEILYSNDPRSVIAPIIYWVILITAAIVSYHLAMRKADLISMARDGDK